MLPLQQGEVVMSLLRKGLLAVVPVVALCVPFMAAAPAQAHEEHHEHWEHHEHHGYYFHTEHFVSPSVVYYTSPVVTARPVTVFYRTNPYSPWLSYSSYPGYDAANSVALSLRLRGFEIFIR
jgi:hypothetical protein